MDIILQRISKMWNVICCTLKEWQHFVDVVCSLCIKMWCVHFFKIVVLLVFSGRDLHYWVRIKMATTRVGNGSDGPVTGNGVTVTPAKASSSSRVAQLGARLKAAAPALPNLPTLPALPQMIRSDKNAAKKNAVQKRPAPVLPSEARMAAEKPQDLNAYATVMARGEVLPLWLQPFHHIAETCRARAQCCLLQWQWDAGYSAGEPELSS